MQKGHGNFQPEPVIQTSNQHLHIIHNATTMRARRPHPNMQDTNRAALRNVQTQQPFELGFRR